MPARGIRVIRFANRDIFDDPDRVADAIYLVASAPLPPRVRCTLGTFPHKEGRKKVMFRQT